MTHAYKAHPIPCKVCNEIHYYITNKHVTIIGTQEELEHAGLPFPIESYDSEKCDIKDCMNVFGHFPELDTLSRSGITKNIARHLPIYSNGFSLDKLVLSLDKNEVTITYKRANGR